MLHMSSGASCCCRHPCRRTRGTGSHDDHGPADTTKDEAEHAVDDAGLAKVAESDHDEGTGETDAGEAETEELVIGDGFLANEGWELEGHQRNGDDPVHVSVLDGNFSSSL